jgi:hypothetical protein
MIETHRLLNQALNDFQALTLQLEEAIEAFAYDQNRSVDLDALCRARDAALYGGRLAQIELAAYQRAA